MSDEPAPRLPDLPLPGGGERSNRQTDSRNAGTILALFGLGMFVFGFIGFVALVLPQVRGLVLVFFGAVGFFALHYVLWGWWLPKLMHSDDATKQH